MLNSYPLTGTKFNVNCLINNNISYFKKVINLYISYTLDTWSRDLNTDFTLRNCLFAAVKLTKNDDPDECRYRLYGIEFGARSPFPLPDGICGKNVIIFELITVLMCMLIIKRRIS